MKRVIVVALLVLASLFAVMVKSTWPARGNTEDKIATDKWEYLALAGATTTNFTPTAYPSMRKEESGFAREGFVLEQHLDKLGAKGWELVSIGGPPTDPVYYFKRRK